MMGNAEQKTQVILNMTILFFMQKYDAPFRPSDGLMMMFEENGEPSLLLNFPELKFADAHVFVRLEMYNQWLFIENTKSGNKKGFYSNVKVVSESEKIALLEKDKKAGWSFA